MDFDTRYKNLNSAQKQAVDTVDGPVMVIAGPGTGKTELLSMRAANILRKTDALASNILCLTFTESGARAMRERLSQIIGRDAYRVTINTFHSFGTEIISNNREYFYRGAEFQPADDIRQLEILTSIFDTLDYSNVLASKMNDEYTHLSETLTTISELKRSGLTSDELLKTLDASDAVLDYIEPDISEVFSQRVSDKMIEKIPPIIEKLGAFTPDSLPRGLAPLSDVIMHSLTRMLVEASEQDSTKPLTAWKKLWCEKNTKGELVLKDRRRHEKLRAVSYIYYQYLVRMQEAALYDYDDMILEVIHAIETQPDLKYNLQETYQYIMVDEFQDTNLAQARLLLNLVDAETNEGEPNLLVVGDDDQAIYSFQGADVGNILQLRREYPAFHIIALTDNYRSTDTILNTARDVITQGTERLESTIESLDKTLTPHREDSSSQVSLREYSDANNERSGIAAAIKKQIAAGQSPSEIAVIARKHAELEALVPYLLEQNISVSYEHNDDILELDIIKQLELLARIVVAIYKRRLHDAEELLPELLSHPVWNIEPSTLWRLGLDTYHEHRLWLDYMSTMPDFTAIHSWLIETAALVPHQPLETMIDRLIGIPDENEPAFSSPIFAHYFSEQSRADNPMQYLTFLDALAKLRSELRDYIHGNNRPTITDLLDFITLHRKYGRSITLTRTDIVLPDAVQLMSAHKSKGLEFDTVYILGLDDHMWGSRVRKRSRSISYPENMPLSPQTGSTDEQIRLLYVGMTRARSRLELSYSTRDDKSKEHLMSDLLISDTLTPKPVESDDSLDTRTEQAEFDWRAHVTTVEQATMRELLTPRLAHYKLSATHVNSFVDVTRGGPRNFLLHNLLHFPSASSPAAIYGTAIHTTLQIAQNHLLATGQQRPLEDSLHDFETMLDRRVLGEKDHTFYAQRGYDTLRTFLDSPYTGFSKHAKSEMNFGSESVHVDDAILTGKLDLITINKSAKTISVIDYKTGKPSTKWTGGAEYEKIKLHKYKQQMMFYKLLTEHSRSYHDYEYLSGALQFVEPDKNGDVAPPLIAEFTDDEYVHFTHLVAAIWNCITNLDLPDVSDYDDTLSGIKAFEQALIDKYA